MIRSIKLVRASGNQLCQFEDEVNQLITEGWQPSGPLNVIIVDKIDILVQQMFFPTNSPD
jgi:hypothetical protein